MTDTAKLTEDQIKHMADRFLGWRLPENFNPDSGISFEPIAGKDGPFPFRSAPSGTNLFDACQATAMVRYMAEGMPSSGSALQSGSEGAMDDSFNSEAAGATTSKMWMELGEQIAAAIPDIIIGSDDPVKAIRWATCAEACFWKATGEADAHDVKDVLPKTEQQPIAPEQGHSP